MVKKKEIFLFIVLILLGIFFIYIYSYIEKAKNEIFDRIEENQINQISYVLKNMEEDIVNSNNLTSAEDLVSLFKQESIREEYEHIISLMLTSNVKYVYILYKDEKERFRFLLDASKTDKANFYQKFDVVDNRYVEIYNTKKPLVIKQHDMENLYLTYLYPIMKGNKVIGIFNVDATTNIQTIILKSIKPLETFFVILIIFIFMLMIMTVTQIFHYFITKKKIFTDTLTNTFNRNYFKEITPMLNLDHYSIAMLDLDRFKSINDTYGHDTGDYILSQASQVFKQSIRDNDILIRYGGEEFLLLIHKRYKDDPTLDVCERIRNNIALAKLSKDGHDINITVSIGVNEHPSLDKDIQEAIKTADKMLYIAKKDGRNRVVCFDEKLINSFTLSSKGIDFVKKALEEDRVICHFQPIYDHNKNKILKYEALVRIIDDDASVISPMQFLPQLKHTNIHYKLTQKILSIVFEKFKNNHEFVSININFSDLINQDIENTIIETLKNNRELASRITFEILESDEVDNIELFKEKINLLKSLNTKVSIDDFGSGYSNFRTTIDIEANYLKIDGSLIKNIHLNEKDFKVVKSIIHFAQQSDMKTIAEFVHSKDVYDKLMELEIDYMQGYYISKPLCQLAVHEDLFK